MDALLSSATDALLIGREKWTARWKRALLLAKLERRWALDALLGGWERDVDCEVEQGSASC